MQKFYKTLENYFMVSEECYLNFQ